MSTPGWLLAGAAAFALAVEIVRRVLRRRLRQKEAGYERDFSARLDEELPALLDEEDEGEQ